MERREITVRGGRGRGGGGGGDGDRGHFILEVLRMPEIPACI